LNHILLAVVPSARVLHEGIAVMTKGRYSENAMWESRAAVLTATVDATDEESAFVEPTVHGVAVLPNTRSGTFRALALVLGIVSVVVVILMQSRRTTPEGLREAVYVSTQDEEYGEDGTLKCHTLGDWEPGYKNLTWEKEHGVVEHPEWYEGTGLSPDSPLEDFQARLNKKDPSNFPHPCNACTQGQVHDEDGNCKTGASAADDSLVFYMYRAQEDLEYEYSNMNTANLAGVLWYLQNEVLQPYCLPEQVRKFDITRIKRLRVTLKNPPQPDERKFSAFFAYDRGRCSTPECMDFYNENGYVVGCQMVADNRLDGFAYPKPTWYSLPGPCPLYDFDVKPPGCEAGEPGGLCVAPTGAADCTYSIEDAGEAQLAELAGIADMLGFCADGKGEYDKGIDGGYGVDFWNGGRDVEKNKARMKAVMDFFESQYPDMPKDLPDPVCEWG